MIIDENAAILGKVLLQLLDLWLTRYALRFLARQTELTSSPVLDVTITSIRMSSLLPVDFLTFAPVMVYLWHSRTGVDNLDKTLNHIIAVTWGSAAVPSVFQIIAVSMYNSDSVRNLRFAMHQWR